LGQDCFGPGADGGVYWSSVVAGFIVGVLLVAWDRKGSVGITGDLIQGVNGDLSARIDVVAKNQIQRRTTGFHETVQVFHYTLLPEEGTAVKVLIAGTANHLAAIVQAIANAEKISGHYTEIPHDALLPNEGVDSRVAWQAGVTYDLALGIDGPRVSERAPQGSNVGRSAVLPYRTVLQKGSAGTVEIRGDAVSRIANNLPGVVDADRPG
jgi:hypothetical protein